MKSMKKIIFVISIIGIIVLGLYLAIRFSAIPKNNNQKLTVVTTIFPLYDFVKVIGQDKVEVSLLLPPGIEAHNFEPRPSDISKINEADIFIYTGKLMEPWAEDIINGLSSKSLLVIDASASLFPVGTLIDNQSELSSEQDPHIWLDFGNDKQIIQAIVEALIMKDVPNADYYRAQASDYQILLSDLDSRYLAALQECKSREIIYGGHYAFAYLAKRYNLQYFSAQGISPDSEPTAQDFVKLSEQIKQNNIKYIFYVELASPKIAETIARETGAQMLLLNASHNVSREDLVDSKTFLQIMEENLNNLKIGLECKK